MLFRKNRTASELIEEGAEDAEKLRNSILKIVVQANFENLEGLVKSGVFPDEVHALSQRLSEAVHNTLILDRTEMLSVVEYEVRLKIRSLMSMTKDNSEPELLAAGA